MCRWPSKEAEALYNDHFVDCRTLAGDLLHGEAAVVHMDRSQEYRAGLDCARGVDSLRPHVRAKRRHNLDAAVDRMAAVQFELQRDEALGIFVMHASVASGGQRRKCAVDVGCGATGRKHTRTERRDYNECAMVEAYF